MPSDTILAVSGIERTSSVFRKMLSALADELGVDVDWLATVIAFESAGTFDPGISNTGCMAKAIKAGTSGSTCAVGLIQFTPVGAAAVKMTQDALAAMTREDQLAYVRKYFLPYKGKLQSLVDTYFVVLRPKSIGSAPDTVIWKIPEGQYVANSGFDKNKTGQITVAMVAKTIHDVYDAAGGKRVSVNDGGPGPQPLPQPPPDDQPPPAGGSAWASWFAMAVAAGASYWAVTKWSQKRRR
jgi:hypothetical protein